MNSADKAVQHAIKQIREMPGGIVLDLRSEVDLEAVVNQISRRVARSDISHLDIMIVSDGKVLKILRYKNK